MGIGECSPVGGKSRRWLSRGVSLGCRGFVECPWQACDSQQNRGYSIFRRQEQPTTFAIASPYFSSHNSLILLNSSFPTDQPFVNHFFYILEVYIYFCEVNIFSFSVSIINSLSIFFGLSFFIFSTHEVGGFSGGACSISS